MVLPQRDAPPADLAAAIRALKREREAEVQPAGRSLFEVRSKIAAQPACQPPAVFRPQ